MSPAVRRLACVMTLNRLIATGLRARDARIGSGAYRRSPTFSTPTSMGSRKTCSTRCSTSCTPTAPLVQTALVARERSLSDLDSNGLALRDLTSTYWWRWRSAPTGPSRLFAITDLDCKQLVVGLVLNRDGFAITHEIFAGNAQDRTTLCHHA